MKKITFCSDFLLLRRFIKSRISLFFHQTEDECAFHQITIHYRWIFTTECPPDVLLDDHLKAKVYEKNYTGRSSARMTTWRQKNVKKLHYPVDQWFDKITNPSALDGTLDIKGNFYTNLVKILMHHWRCP